MNQLEKFRDINTFIFDVDGVLTNSELIITESGELLRKMNTRDGYAMRRAVVEGYKVYIITGGKSKGVISRLQALGIHKIYSGAKDKMDALQDLVDVYDVDLQRTLYMGDDVPDYEVMRRVHLPVCPADAAHEIQAIAQYVSPVDGGRGCVRDVIEKVLRLRGGWVDGAENPKLDLEK